MKNGWKIVFILLFAVNTLFAQYFQAGQDPASVKWKQINTFDFQIIYPNTFDKEARRLASVLKEVYEYAGKSLNHNPRRISIILHTHTAKSNGFVAWAPRRMEFYATPHQGMYAQDWLEQLAIHELRHAVQIDKIQLGLPEIFKIILGQQAAIMSVAAYLPTWFLEGDAVCAETALSKAGRGRQPSFLMNFDAQLAEKGPYSYHKAYLGSYKDFVPNHYELGYRLIGEARVRYGKDVWEKVLNHVARKPLNFWNFDNKLKEITQKNKSGLYTEIIGNEREKVLAGIAHYRDEGKWLTPLKKRYTGYRFAGYLPDGKLIALREGLSDIGRIVSIDPGSGKEKVLFTPGYYDIESVSVTDGIVVWTERRPHARWTHSDNSVICFYNHKNKRVWEIMAENKVFAPALSPDHSRVAVVEVDLRNNYSIVVMDVTTGKEVKRFSTPENYFYMVPSWEDNENLLAVILGKKGKSIARMNPYKGTLTELLPFSYTDIKRPVRKGEYIYYIGAYNGKNELYALNESGEVFKVATSRFGLTDHHLGEEGKTLVSDYSSDGYRLKELFLNSDRFEKINPVKPHVYPLAKALSVQEGKQLTFEKSDDAFASGKYPKAKGLLNFHSWAPAFIDVDDEGLYPGFSLLSQNKLSTAETVLGYKYDADMKTGKWHGNFKYMGFWPVIEVEGELGKDGVKGPFILTREHQNGEIVPVDTISKLLWNQSDLRINISLPLSFAKFGYQQLVYPQVGWEYSKAKMEDRRLSNRDGDVHLLKYRLYIHNLQRMAYQDVFPDWGQVVDITYKHTPGGNRDHGELFAAQGRLYFPGLLKNHGIKLYGGLQLKSDARSGLSDVVRFPRGVGKRINDQLFSFGADYKLPLLYPDWNLGKLLYIKRVKADLFYDFSAIEGNENRNISSFGAELTTDCHFVGFPIPVDMGLRMAYSPEMEDISVGFLFLFNLSML